MESFKGLKRGASPIKPYHIVKIIYGAAHHRLKLIYGGCRRLRSCESFLVDEAAKVEQMMQDVIVLEPSAVQPRILYRMLFERGLRDQHLRCSLHSILGARDIFISK